MDVVSLAKRARNSLSRYCFEECSAYCCKKGYLVLTSKQLDLIAKDKKEGLTDDNRIIKMENGKYSLNLDKDCPALKKNKCTVHKNPARPKACKEFPLFIWKNKTIRISERCPAVKEGKLYYFIAEFKKQGYNINKYSY